jgi:hypothetical protein
MFRMIDLPSSSGKTRETPTLLDPVHRTTNREQLHLPDLTEYTCLPLLPEDEGTSILWNVVIF